jgi:hypothetical protein
MLAQHSKGSEMTTVIDARKLCNIFIDRNNMEAVQKMSLAFSLMAVANGSVVRRQVINMPTYYVCSFMYQQLYTWQWLESLRLYPTNFPKLLQNQYVRNRFFTKMKWNNNNSNYIVEYSSVAKRCLCKQQPLLWSARSLRVRGDVTQQEKRRCRRCFL